MINRSTRSASVANISNASNGSLSIASPPPRLRVRDEQFPAQRVVTIEVEDDSAGFVVLLNEGSDGGKQSLFRACNVDARLLDRITLTPGADGMLVVDVYGERFPETVELSDHLRDFRPMHDIYAPGEPPIIKNIR